VILHITERKDWTRAQEQGVYTAEALSSEGFIHCSEPQQVIEVANFLFRGRSGLVLLCIDSSRVTAEIRYENLEGGKQLYPHIYGPLNIDAVMNVLSFEPGEHGCFVLPPELS